MAEVTISQPGTMSVRETVLVLFDHSEQLYKLSRDERASTSDDLSMDIIAHADGAQADCAGYATRLRDGHMANSREVIDVLQKLAVIEHPQVKAMVEQEYRNSSDDDRMDMRHRIASADVNRIF
jgi:hypothetical protein